MSGRFYLLFAFLFSVGPLEASREILLCKSPSLEVWYTLCGMDLLRVSVQVDVWKQSVKVSEYKYVLCSGADDYYPFCGAIKGETIEFSSDTLLPRLHLVQVMPYYFTNHVILIFNTQRDLKCVIMNYRLALKAKPAYRVYLMFT
ncbi:uncharacterized protein LOC121394746 isoform X3 [Xenopus laevis]|uniref:Uncharacterized protein LOC121394746 isoform X3 n=1 Tax=Xenopus laevis TaxID=8355 RepID=A0A8J1KYQ0_XENLA|nr:uncharacterized protein LOC121394746 isoform X3 [Xenopus laevis]